MAHYFLLQYRRLYRHLQAAGIQPYIGIIGIVLIFFALSEILFQKLQYAAYLYPFVAVSMVNLLGGIERNAFLKNCFSIANYKKIRLVENLIAATPFFIFLIYKQQYVIALSIYPLGVSLSFFNQINRFRIVIPTPFYKYPFEFTVGFRQYYWLFGITYLIAGISVIVGNFNISIFTLLFIFLSCLSFYGKPEPEFYVWIHAAKPTSFLKQKVKIAVLYSLVLSLPLFALLMFFYPENIQIILLVEVLGTMYLLTFLLGKYAYYPSEINLIPGFLITISIFMPPFLVIVIPFLYFRAKRNLQSILT